ncbi:MAG: CDP-2,3-bis-(O-geranylgeranyl)-sn-glycerol synthase [Candidatus Micrarchaeota archaeon]|nr:CDP-2,3-bis-(O-geranylgeranyl)-sn-glycerol synthase [Candidatus Micrarchaeota archaeon]
MAFDFYSWIIYPLIYIFPAYACNGAPVIFGGGMPIDMGRKLYGKRIFGDNKTIRGAVAGAIAGIAVGAIEYPFFSYMVTVSVAMVVGAIAGDLLGSFIKRRAGFKSGHGIPVLDQYGFVVLALLFAYPLGNFPQLYGLVFILVLTGVLHVLTNIGAHRLSLKSVPW